MVSFSPFACQVSEFLTFLEQNGEFPFAVSFCSREMHTTHVAQFRESWEDPFTPRVPLPVPTVPGYTHSSKTNTGSLNIPSFHLCICVEDFSIKLSMWKKETRPVVLNVYACTHAHNHSLRKNGNILSV